MRSPIRIGFQKKKKKNCVDKGFCKIPERWLTQSSRPNKSAEKEKKLKIRNDSEKRHTRSQEATVVAVAHMKLHSVFHDAYDYVRFGKTVKPAVKEGSELRACL
jgi:hypothetical protein